MNLILPTLKVVYVRISRAFSCLLLIAYRSVKQNTNTLSKNGLRHCARSYHCCSLPVTLEIVNGTHGYKIENDKLPSLTNV